MIDSLSVIFLPLFQGLHISGHHILQNRLQHSPALGEGRFCPFYLRLFCLCDCSVYSILGDGVHTAK